MLFSLPFFQGLPLNRDPRRGIIIANQTLVLQKLSRNQTGSYHCAAVNEEGTAYSNPVSLDVKCELVKMTVSYSLDN